MENFYEKPEIKIETINGPDGSEVSFCPERGGIITSIKLKEKEVLYLEADTLADKTKNVRGGIPILFPNAGPIKEGKYPLPQHGYARTSDKWEVEPGKKNEFSEKLSTNEDMVKLFPYDLSLRMKAKMEQEDGSVSLSEEVTNEDENKELPVAMGLHPYFRVPDAEKMNIKFDFEGGKDIEKDFKTWSDGGTTVIDNPKLKDEKAVLRIEIPELGTLIMDVSKEYRKIWIWTLPGKDFICIEPAMRAPGGLERDPEMIKPGQTFTAGVNLKIE